MAICTSSLATYSGISGLAIITLYFSGKCYYYTQRKKQDYEASFHGYIVLLFRSFLKDEPNVELNSL